MLIKSSDISSLQFYFPEYELVSDLSVRLSSRFILTSPVSFRDLKRLPDESTYFAVGSPFKYDLDVKESLVEFLLLHKPQFMTRKSLDVLLTYPDEEFFYTLKTNWFSKNLIKVSDYQESIYPFFESTLSSIKTQLESLFVQTSPFPVVESSFFTFLKRVMSHEDQEVKPTYKRLLRESFSRVGHRIPKCVDLYISNHNLSPELRLIQFLMNLRGL